MSSCDPGRWKGEVERTCGEMGKDGRERWRGRVERWRRVDGRRERVDGRWERVGERGGSGWLGEVERTSGEVEEGRRGGRE